MADIFERHGAKAAGQDQRSMGATQAAAAGFREFFGAMYPGLTLEKLRQDISVELKRLGVQGSAEIAAALFSESNAFVPYGRGQWPGKPGQDAAQLGMDGEHKEGQPNQQDRQHGRSL